MANILWVEEDYKRIKGLFYFLEDEGHKVISALTKKEAFQILEKRDDISLIVVDLAIPEGETVEPFEPYPGFKVLDKFQQLNKKYPIIALTVFGEDSEIKIRLNKYPIANVLTKGVFRPSELQDVVHKILKQQEN